MIVSAAIGASVASGKVDDRERPLQGEAREPEARDASPRDRVTISREAQARAGGARQPGAKGLTAEQQRQLSDLRQRDAHVRQHEAAHQAAGGSLVGGASFSYQTGPDGRSYAVGGEVPVRLASGRTPDETISNARQARAAALAPSDPSPQDLSVAAAATQLEMSASRQKALKAAKAYGKAAEKRDGEDRTSGAESTSRSGDLDEEPERVEASRKAA